MKRFWLLGCYAFSLHAAPIFNYPMSLSDFGERANLIPNLQPGVRLSPAGAFRTNDYHTLQLKQALRAMTRIGAFQISQSFQAGGVGAGPGIVFPERVFTEAVDGITTSVNPRENVTASLGETLVIFDSFETQTYNISTEYATAPTTFQSLILKYEDPSNPSDFIRDYNVVGNAFHDVRYENLTPIIRVDSFTKLKEVVVFTSADLSTSQTFTGASPGGPSQVVFPPGFKFRLTFEDFITKKTYVWLLYVQPPETTPAANPSIIFTASFDGSSPPSPVAQGIVLTAQSGGTGVPFTGFLRLGVVRDTPVPLVQANTAQQPPLTSPTVPKEWSSALAIQTVAASPASMYMLWPTEFVTTAMQRIKQNLLSSPQTFPPNCANVSIYLPMMALTDFNSANQVYSVLKNGGTGNFHSSLNFFSAYFNMVFAKLMASEIRTYQQQNRKLPSYTINATAASIEKVYDTHRGCIPNRAEIAFAENNYQWNYTTFNLSSSTANQPLILFPAYKTLFSPTKPISTFVVDDPFKGNLLAISATGNIMKFQEGALPSFLTSGNYYFPSSVCDKITPDLLAILWKLLNETPIQITPNPTLIYTSGQIANATSQLVRYASCIMKKMGKSDAAIIAKTKPTIDGLKKALEDLLINRQKAAGPTSTTTNFFLGDSTVGGICTSTSGMANTNILDEFGNALYNDHHLQYSYWLNVAATIVDWDNTYNSSDPWIAKEFMTSQSAGPYKMKYFVDMLWRDTCNPDPEDPALPYSRHGHPWEGHRTANGVSPTTALTNGRNEESVAEDFYCWLGTLAYAQSVLKSNGLDATDTMGFDTLVTFCKTNLALTATGATLYYKTSLWPYANTDFGKNVAVGNQWDSLIDSRTFFQVGTPPCSAISSLENRLFSKSRFEIFQEGAIGQTQDEFDILQ